MRIIFQNENFLVVDKQWGTLSIPGRDPNDPRPNEWRTWEEKLGTRLWVVHRIDSEVSGVLLFAKCAEAHRTANFWFEKRQVHKTYEALAEVSADSLPLEEAEVSWRSHLLRGKRRAYEKPFGKESITRAQALGWKSYGEAKFRHVQLRPLTGRPHQLRFEMAKHASPIWGDSLYGAHSVFPIPSAIALRATSLDFSECPDHDVWGLPDKVTTSSLLELINPESSGPLDKSSPTH